MRRILCIAALATIASSALAADWLLPERSNETVNMAYTSGWRFFRYQGLQGAYTEVQLPGERFRTTGVFRDINGPGTMGIYFTQLTPWPANTQIDETQQVIVRCYAMGQQTGYATCSIRFQGNWSPPGPH